MSNIIFSDPADNKAEQVLLEVCVDNMESVINAEKGGARRLEMCSALSEGGLTPSVGLLRMAKAQVKIPIFVMIRPRCGDFIYSEDEVSIMKFDIESLKGNRADGFVFGVLDSNGNVDETINASLIEAARPLPCTFHRAFDHVVNQLEGLQTIIKLGFNRILTSGQQPNAFLGIPRIKELVNAADGKIIIMPGCGINAANVNEIVTETKVSEVHGSASAKMASKMLCDNLVSMSSKAASDDFCYSVSNHDLVANIVKNANIY